MKIVTLAVPLTPLLLLPATELRGQDLRALVPTESYAMRAITEGRVRTTVSFLASDELGGRDTPSIGLTVASAYVAARFRGAGLEGLGEKGSFYITASFPVVPKDGFTLQRGGKPVPILGILAATTKPFEFSGNLAEIGDAAGGDVACVDARDAKTLRRAAMDVVRRTRSAMRRGAKALIVRAKADSRVAKLCAELRAEPRGELAQMTARARMPIVIVGPDLEAGKIELKIPACTLAPSQNRNVAGVLRGSDPKLAKEALLITAHLDHVGTFGRGADRIHNGADDNATGVTGVLSLADAFAALKERPKRSVIFMTFWGEEKGLVGSRHFAKHPKWPLEKIVANVNLEMLGRPEEGARYKTWMTGWTKSDLGELLAIGAKRAEVEVFRHRRFSPMLYRASDNWSFADRGVIAHSFSAGSLHDDYHKPGDEWEKLDLEHMTKVIQGLFAGCLPIADGTFTPRKR